jgi:predicted TIM-barrel fold metal-dependent hydrolase
MNVSAVSTLPGKLQMLAGRIVDIDTHEMIPAQEWVNIFGKKLQPMVDYYLNLEETVEQNPNSPNVPDWAGDTRAIDAEVLNLKGSRAPGAADPKRRVAVMNQMGVSRQLIYSTGIGLLAVPLYASRTQDGFMSMVQGDRRGTAKDWFNRYNDWIVDSVKISNRLRPVALLFGDTPEEVIERARKLIKGGVRAVSWVSVHDRPGGRSPAHPDLDPLWAMLAEANCAFTLHIEPDGRPLREKPWQDAPAFEGFRSFGEVHQDPSHLSTLHVPYELWLTIMVLGGVLDRHPTLRVGVIECGSGWVGPLMQRLDLWYKVAAAFNRVDGVAMEREHALKLKPSDYFKRNIRVTPFHFEDITFDLENFDVKKVICFSSDYPHVEGGKDAFSIFYKRVEKFGSEVIEDFFVNNGALLMPE